MLILNLVTMTIKINHDKNPITGSMERLKDYKQRKPKMSPTYDRKGLCILHITESKKIGD